MKKICESNQSGRSMIEMLGVLAIIGVLSVGGVSGYSKAMAKYRANKTIDQVSMLIVNIRTLYANQVSYEGLDTANAIKFELVSQDMIKNNALVNPYGGTITLATADDDLSFTVTYEGIDRQGCLTIATSDWGGTASSGLVSMSVGASDFSFEDDSFPVTLTNADTACASDSDNDISWTYH